MRILLVNPPNCGRSIPEELYGITSLKQIFRGEPLALETLAGNLIQHDVQILDLKVNPDGLHSRLTSFAPDLVGFTAMTCEANTVIKLAGEVRQSCAAKIVVGGIHASTDPEFFNCEVIDWVVIGLGKQSFPELVEAIERDQNTEIPGIARSTKAKKPLSWQPRKYNQSDLVNNAAPRYDLVENYRSHYTLQTLGLKMGLVSSALGCPYDCNFCCIYPLTGGRYLTADIETVIRDILTLEQTPVIRLVDANSFGNPSHAWKLAEAIEKAGIHKQYLADVRSDMVVRQPQLLKRWKEIGLRAVVIGFEEIDDNALSQMNKENSAATNREAIAILHQLGLTIVGDFIISPDYTEQQFDQLHDFVCEQAIDLPMHTILTPLPGTKLHHQVQSQIKIHDLDYYTLTNAVMPTRLNEKLFYQRYASLLHTGHSNAKV
ncbi:B12-binding domain-containing radical SAM protein [uncultured Desulfuromusa sp.]|uniref:B12-binding domain-containing radical SAM protein n=1 Tax=uncultured Desulfuromusa sp. TaxID=219183 RepID=UPI002AA84BFE|nr:radical SAM protein [uncultured Desulfuromusa sp.]